MHQGAATGATGDGGGMADGEVRFYRDRVRLRMKEAGEAALRAVAFAIEARAQQQVVANNQVDTGFMLNSLHTVTRQGSGYAAAQAATAGALATGRREPADLAPDPARPADAAAGVVASAAYAIYQEERQSFLFAAAEAVCREAGATVEAVARKELSRD